MYNKKSWLSFLVVVVASLPAFINAMEGVVFSLEATELKILGEFLEKNPGFTGFLGSFREALKGGDVEQAKRLVSNTLDKQSFSKKDVSALQLKTTDIAGFFKLVPTPLILKLKLLYYFGIEADNVAKSTTKNPDVNKAIAQVQQFLAEKFIDLFLTNVFQYVYRFDDAVKKNNSTAAMNEVSKAFDLITGVVQRFSFSRDVEFDRKKNFLDKCREILDNLEADPSNKAQPILETIHDLKGSIMRMKSDLQLQEKETSK